MSDIYRVNVPHPTHIYQGFNFFRGKPHATKALRPFFPIFWVFAPAGLRNRKTQKRLDRGGPSLVKIKFNSDIET
ncbi:MAG: hypothetical protein RLZZ338_4435 [Cyanobacteriota bacterium]|jgi:hypothetical protein